MPTKILGKDEPRALLFKQGTILWRPVHMSSGGMGSGSFGARIADVEFEKTEKDSYMCRLSFHGTGIYEPVLHSSKADAGRYGKIHTFGCVVFLKELPPENWTHLVVNGTSLAMREPPKWDQIPPIKGGAVFAKIAEPYDMTKYLNFRQRLFTACFDNLYNDFDTKVKSSLDHWPEDYREGDRRLVYGEEYMALNDSARFDLVTCYAYLVINSQINQAPAEQPQPEKPKSLAEQFPRLRA